MNVSKRSVAALCSAIMICGSVMSCAPESNTRATKVTKIRVGELVQKTTPIAGYEALWKADDTVTIVLRDTRGGAAGRLDLVRDGGDRLDLTMPDGQRVSMWSSMARSGDGEIHAYRKFAMGAEDLEIQALLNQDRTVKSLYYATNQGRHALLIKDDTHELSPAQVTAWLDTTADIPNLTKGQALLTMLMTTADPSLMLGIAESQGLRGGTSALEATQCAVEFEPAPGGADTTPAIPAPTTDHDVPEAPVPARPGDNARHTSAMCSTILGALFGGTIASCIACAGAIAAAVPTGGVTAVLGGWTCIICFAVLGGTLLDVIACIYSYVTALTQAQCNAQCPSWATCTLAADEHSCSNACDATKCNNSCVRLQYASGQCGGVPGFPGNGCICIANTGVPTCHP